MISKLVQATVYHNFYQLKALCAIIYGTSLRELFFINVKTTRIYLRKRCSYRADRFNNLTQYFVRIDNQFIK